MYFFMSECIDDCATRKSSFIKREVYSIGSEEIHCQSSIRQSLYREFGVCEQLNILL
jgi:hypothetical protein